ncbi:uncharacterized protein LOC108683256 [Hyalella azteca]|uniref:Uncharacterized protein LOC108683256 n=1 Tax=Hyalella azteca TaxID=294128 RepID=A0A979FPG5_HYAAZ|nr:uncharacterized protein LOC108683256 [Hyalella azteca]
MDFNFSKTNSDESGNISGIVNSSLASSSSDCKSKEFGLGSESSEVKSDSADKGDSSAIITDSSDRHESADSTSQETANDKMIDKRSLEEQDEFLSRVLPDGLKRIKVNQKVPQILASPLSTNDEVDSQQKLNASSPNSEFAQVLANQNDPTSKSGHEAGSSPRKCDNDQRVQHNEKEKFDLESTFKPIEAKNRKSSSLVNSSHYKTEKSVIDGNLLPISTNDFSEKIGLHSASSGFEKKIRENCRSPPSGHKNSGLSDVKPKSSSSNREQPPPIESNSICPSMSHENETFTELPLGDANENEAALELSLVDVHENETSAELPLSDILDEEMSNELWPKDARKNETSSELPPSDACEHETSTELQPCDVHVNETSTELPSSDALENETSTEPIDTHENETSTELLSNDALGNETSPELPPSFAHENETSSNLPLIAVPENETPAALLSSDASPNGMANEPTDAHENKTSAELRPCDAHENETTSELPHSDGDETSTELPSIDALENETSTEIPSIDALKNETSAELRPRDAQENETSTVLPSIDALENETDANENETPTELPSVYALENEKSTELPPICALGNEKSPELPPSDAFENETSTEPIDALENEASTEPIDALENEASTEPIDALENEASTEPPNSDALGNETSTELPPSGAPEKETSTEVPSIMDVLNAESSPEVNEKSTKPSLMETTVLETIFNSDGKLDLTLQVEPEFGLNNQVKPNTVGGQDTNRTLCKPSTNLRTETNLEENQAMSDTESPSDDVIPVEATSTAVPIVDPTTFNSEKIDHSDYNECLGNNSVGSDQSEIHNRNKLENNASDLLIARKDIDEKFNGSTSANYEDSSEVPIRGTNVSNALLTENNPFIAMPVDGPSNLEEIHDALHCEENVNWVASDTDASEPASGASTSPDTKSWRELEKAVAGTSEEIQKKLFDLGHPSVEPDACEVSRDYEKDETETFVSLGINENRIEENESKIVERFDLQESDNEQNIVIQENPESNFADSETYFSPVFDYSSEVTIYSSEVEENPSKIKMILPSVSYDEDENQTTPIAESLKNSAETSKSGVGKRGCESDRDSSRAGHFKRSSNRSSSSSKTTNDRKSRQKSSTRNDDGENDLLLEKGSRHSRNSRTRNEENKHFLRGIDSRNNEKMKEDKVGSRGKMVKKKYDEMPPDPSKSLTRSGDGKNKDVKFKHSSDSSASSSKRSRREKRFYSCLPNLGDDTHSDDDEHQLANILPVPKMKKEEHRKKRSYSKSSGQAASLKNEDVFEFSDKSDDGSTNDDTSGSFKVRCAVKEPRKYCLRSDQKSRRSKSDAVAFVPLLRLEDSLQSGTSRALHSRGYIEVDSVSEMAVHEKEIDFLPRKDVKIILSLTKNEGNSYSSSIFVKRPENFEREAENSTEYKKPRPLSKQKALNKGVSKQRKENDATKLTAKDSEKALYPESQAESSELPRTLNPEPIKLIVQQKRDQDDTITCRNKFDFSDSVKNEIQKAFSGKEMLSASGKSSKFSVMSPSHDSYSEELKKKASRTKQKLESISTTKTKNKKKSSAI